jgi:hypothetical protein
MQAAGVRRAGALGYGRQWRATASVMFALAAAGCTTSGQPTALFGGAGASTIAFESIDGPPPAVFHKLVSRLGEEAEARRVTVVSRDGAASYRVRGYLSAQVERSKTSSKTSIAWVLDVYDADKQRVVRLSGHEPTSHLSDRHGHNAWAAADDQVLHQIARASMERIGALLNSPAAPAAPAPSPEPNGTTMAMTEGDAAPGTSSLVRTAAAVQNP